MADAWEHIWTLAGIINDGEKPFLRTLFLFKRTIYADYRHLHLLALIFANAQLLMCASFFLHKSMPMWNKFVSFFSSLLPNLFAALNFMASSVSEQRQLFSHAIMFQSIIPNLLFFHFSPGGFMIVWQIIKQCIKSQIQPRHPVCRL